jgi:hypothetical protein
MTEAELAAAQQAQQAEARRSEVDQQVSNWNDYQRRTFGA